MKVGQAEYPYDDYILYVIYNKKEGRKYAILHPKNRKKDKSTSLSYARYLMSVKEGRILEDYEEVDHIDSNKLNDSLDNLQILSRTGNRLKEYYRDGAVRYLFKCPNCGKIFSREKKNTHLSKKSKFNCTFCSRHCSCSFSANVQYDNININDDEVKKKIEGKFY